MSYFNQDRTGNAKGLQYAQPHHNHVAEYQQSVIPFVSGSTGNGQPYAFNFPYVTRFIVVSNSSDTDLKIGFTAAGIAANQYFTVQASSTSPRLEVKTKQLWVDASNNKTYEVFAGLTNVASGSFPFYSNDTIQGL